MDGLDLKCFVQVNHEILGKQVVSGRDDMTPSALARETARNSCSRLAKDIKSIGFSALFEEHLVLLAACEIEAHSSNQGLR